MAEGKRTHLWFAGDHDAQTAQGFVGDSQDIEAGMALIYEAGTTGKLIEAIAASTALYGVAGSAKETGASAGIEDKITVQVGTDKNRWGIVPDNLAQIAIAEIEGNADLIEDANGFHRADLDGGVTNVFRVVDIPIKKTNDTLANSILGFVFVKIAASAY